MEHISEILKRVLKDIAENKKQDKYLCIVCGVIYSKEKVCDKCKEEKTKKIK